MTAMMNRISGVAIITVQRIKVRKLGGGANDPNDFTEADAESLQAVDGGEEFETDMSES